MGEWPFDENNERRFLRMLEFYREALAEENPERAAEVDAKMIEWGQDWLQSEMVADVNRMMTAQEIADEFGLNAWNIRTWARRHPDLIPKTKQGGRALFRLGDVLAHWRRKP